MMTQHYAMYSNIYDIMAVIESRLTVVSCKAKEEAAFGGPTESRLAHVRE